MTEQEIDGAAGFDAIRARLVALAYRMLGSRAEAEDVVQDVWLKWHAADPRDVRNASAWLVTVTTRVAIDRLRRLQRERASRAPGWMPQPWLDGVAPSTEELALRAARMSYGVMLLLERLKPDERAAFVLREAFDCDYAEIAQILERTPAACRQIVHRAKGRLQRAGEPLERADAGEHAQLVERLQAALDAQDRHGVRRLLADTRTMTSDASAHAGEPASASLDLLDEIGAHGCDAQCVSIDGAAGIALLRGGEIVALLDVSVSQGKIVALRIVTAPARLRDANGLFGLRAIRRLLGRMRGDAPLAPGRLIATEASGSAVVDTVV